MKIMMKTAYKLLALTLVLCMAAFPAMAMAEDSTLHVLGSATLTVAPDRAMIQFGYSCENPDAAQAQAETAERIAAILEAVQALNIEEDQIATAYLNIYPVYSYTDDNEQVIRGYRVQHMLAVTVDDIDKAGDVLDAALEAGATNIGGVTYMTTRSAEIYNEALALAIENAQDKAEAMSIAAGVWLGNPVEIREQSSYANPLYAIARDEENTAGAGISIGDTLMAGQLEISASVEVVYEMR